MIKSFKDKETGRLFNDEFSKPFQSIERIARRKLMMLDQALTLADLSALPGNRLETLSGDRHGQYSIRINDQYRVCFTWTADGNAENVEVIDYH